MVSIVNIPVPSNYLIGELFEHYSFIVPLYQRNYDWDDPQIEDFLDDLSEIFQGHRDSHFFGQIVAYQRDDNRQEIIDGQQRLTTSLLFLACLKDNAEKLYTSKFGNNQQQVDPKLGTSLKLISTNVDGIIRGDEEYGDAAMVVGQSSSDNELDRCFFDITHGNNISTISKNMPKPIKKMERAYDSMHKWVRKYIQEETTLTDQITVLKSIYRSFVKKFYIVMISTSSLTDAFTIFETLNSRGKSLEPSDIIKNQLFSVLDKNIRDANKQWKNISSTFSSDSKEITKFIRAYWAAKERKVSESKLYRSISQKIKTPDQAETFLRELNELVMLYQVLQSPSSQKRNRQVFTNRSIIQIIDILDKMNVKLYYPIAMAVYHQQFDENDMLLVLHKILSVYVRHRVINKETTNTLETGFSDIARKIWSMDLGTTDKIIDALNSNLLQSNDSIEASFSVLEKHGGQKGAKKWTLLYLISKLYESEYGDFKEQGAYFEVFHDEDFRLIHINSSEELGEHLDRIGNWTILEKGLADKLENDEMSLIIALSNSELNGNRSLISSLESGTWNEDAIDKRQAHFKEGIAEIW